MISVTPVVTGIGFPNPRPREGFWFGVVAETRDFLAVIAIGTAIVLAELAFFVWLVL